jgi:tetratricopeptide (TPR) repeat protein
MRGILVLLLVGGFAAAGEVQEQEARSLFAQGQEAYAAQRYQEAYDLFRRAYLLTPAPPLLYNMASALQSMGRPREAAEELRGYLRARPEDDERPAIEERIRSLEEAQRLLDAARPSPAPVVMVVARPAVPPAHPRRKLAIALGTVGVVVTAAALSLGLGLGLQPHPSDSTLGVHKGTP